MNANIDNMLSATFYKTMLSSFFDNSLVKLITAALLSLFTVPIQFIVAVPLFWALDFASGLYAARREANSKKWFSKDKLNAQYVKMGIHIAFLLGCTWLANLFDVHQFLIFGFGYIVATEFISTIRNLFGDKESVQLINRLKELFLKTIGLNVDLNAKNKEKDK